MHESLSGWLGVIDEGRRRLGDGGVEALDGDGDAAQG